MDDFPSKWSNMLQVVSMLRELDGASLSNQHQLLVPLLHNSMFSFPSRVSKAKPMHSSTYAL